MTILKVFASRASRFASKRLEPASCELNLISFLYPRLLQSLSDSRSIELFSHVIIYHLEIEELI
jgi:hypothetical protein